ncbi:transposase [Telluribacter sp.]|jgi:transposase-like protein|uniref:transposase n=1 Tax=Telluribacter sp. TaxID=1978767 RepID=UPI002E12C79A|nr:transposase [Telluribacter sp.]
MGNLKVKSGKSTKFEFRKRRVFSEAFKREKVAEITSGKITVLELSRLWDVRPWAIYLWIYKYSPNHQKGTTMVVQKDSQADKVKDLLARIAELERIVGQKQLAIDFQDKLIEIASKELSMDLKKNFSPKS